MALSKEMAERFFEQHQADFEAMARLFLAAVDSGDRDYLTYVVTCCERLVTCALAAMRPAGTSEEISWQ
jgi:hypothetical protein